MAASRTSIARVAGLAALATFVDGYDLQSLGLAVPLMAAGMGRPPADFGVALTTTFIGMFFGALVLAPVSDRAGRRTMLVASMAIVTAATAWAALIHSLAPLVCARFVAGLGIGAAVPIAIALVSEHASPANRTTIVTAVVVATGVGAFAAGMLAPAITAAGGWRGIFWLGAVLPAISGALLLVGLPADSSGGTAPNAPRGSVRALLRPPLAARTQLLWLVFPLNLTVTYALIAWLPTLLVAAGWTTTQAQRGTGLVAIGGIAGGLVLGWVADRGRPAMALSVAYGIAAIALPLIGALPPGAWLAALLVAGATSFGASMMLGALSAQFYPSELRATGAGWASGIGRVGSIVGPLAVTFALRGGVPSRFVLAAMVVPMAACMVGVLLLPRPGRDGGAPMDPNSRSNKEV